MIKLKALLHLQHHLPVSTSVFPPSPSSTSWWCSRLSLKRGWVSHLSFRPLIVWHTAAQHGCQGLCRVWIRWPDYHPTRFHSPHTPALPWKHMQSVWNYLHFQRHTRKTPIWAGWFNVSLGPRSKLSNVARLSVRLSEMKVCFGCQCGLVVKEIAGYLEGDCFNVRLLQPP